MVLLNYIKACNMSWWVILPLQMEALEEVTLYYHAEGISKPFRNRKAVDFHLEVTQCFPPRWEWLEQCGWPISWHYVTHRLVLLYQSLQVSYSIIWQELGVWFGTILSPTTPVKKWSSSFIGVFQSWIN